MAELKYVRRNSFYVDVDDFNKFIKEFYDTEYDFEQVEDYLNDECYYKEFSVTKSILNSSQENELECVKQGFNRKYTCWAILTDLCNKDVIEPGEYIFGKDF